MRAGTQLISMTWLAVGLVGLTGCSSNYGRYSRSANLQHGLHAAAAAEIESEEVCCADGTCKNCLAKDDEGRTTVRQADFRGPIGSRSTVQRAAGRC